MTPPAPTPPSRVRRMLFRLRIPAGAAGLVAALALTALMGWWLQIPQLTSLVAGWPTMKVNTALAMLAAALALLLAGVERSRARGVARRRYRLASLALAAWPMLIGLLTVAEYATGRTLGLDELLIRDFWTAPAQFPGRPAPATALGLALAGVALWTWRHPRALVFFSCCVGAIMGLAWLALTGLLYGVHEKAATVFFGTISLPSSACFFLLGIGLFFLRPREGLARIFTSPHHSGQLVRWLVPVAVALTLSLGWLRLRAQTQWQFSTELGVALFGTSMVISLVLIGLRGAWLVDRLDLRRRRSEEQMARELIARTAALERLRESERQLAASEQRFRGIFNSTLQLIGLLAPDGTLLEANQIALDAVGCRPEEVLGRHVADTPWCSHSPALQAQMRAAVARAAEHGEAARFEMAVPTADGMHYLDFSLRPVRDSAGRIINLLPEGSDITVRKRMEESLRQRENELRLLFDFMPALVCFKDKENNILRVNKRLAESVGKAIEEIEGRASREIYPHDAEKYYADDLEVIHSGVPKLGIVETFRDARDREVWIRTDKVPVRDTPGAVIGLVAMAQDISEQHEAAQRIQASLAEKEVLLREIHHRVKNNLQVITSLLQLQSGYLHDPRDAEMFRECQARIHAMGLVHDRLYRSDNLSTIDFSAHLGELIALIVRGQSGVVERIRVEVESEPVEVDLDTAIPLGLITSELIANAYKHAFPEGCRGVISVRLARISDREFALTVEDDGVGLPADFDPKKARSLGLRLIRALAGQLKAELSIATSPAGSKVGLVFPI